MSTIEDLPMPNFSKLSDAELTSLILDTRERRRKPDMEAFNKSKKIAEARAKLGKPTALRDISSLMSTLTPEESEALFRILKG